jgi:hypothetical protein
MSFLVPITPATTEPVWMPTRIVSSEPVRRPYASMLAIFRRSLTPSKG